MCASSGTSWPLPLSRSHYEHMALTEQGKHAPKLVPRVHHYDRNMAMIVMGVNRARISSCAKASSAASNTRCLPAISPNSWRRRCSTLQGSQPPPAEHRRRIWSFADNTELCKITEDLVFTDPYRVAKLNRWTTPFLDEIAAQFRRDEPLKAAVQRRKLQFMSSAEALIHGDLHTGSIMLTPTDTRVIDPEFA